MSVALNPEELGFRRPFTQEVTQTLTITNTDSSPVAFKVKTTAPKQYCVRPNSGLVSPGSSVQVSVLLQAMKEEPPLEAKCRDKFLVQTARTDEVDDTKVTELWANIEKTSKGSILDKKIKVTFLPPAGSTPNGAAVHDEPTSYGTSTPAYGSPAPASLAHTDVRTPSQNQSMYSMVTGTNDTKSPVVAERSTPATPATPAATNANTGLLATIQNAVPTSQAELQDQLSAAQAKIKELSNQLSDPQVRQRKVAEAQEKVTTVVQQSQEIGVPLPWAAGLCLLSFLIAWIFF